MQVRYYGWLTYFIKGKIEARFRDLVVVFINKKDFNFAEISMYQKMDDQVFDATKKHHY